MFCFLSVCEVVFGLLALFIEGGMLWVFRLFVFVGLVS